MKNEKLYLLRDKAYNLLSNHNSNDKSGEYLNTFYNILDMYLNSDFNIDHCIRSFDISTSTYYSYKKKVEKNKSIKYKSRRPKNIEYVYD